MHLQQESCVLVSIVVQYPTANCRYDVAVQITAVMLCANGYNVEYKWCIFVGR